MTRVPAVQPQNRNPEIWVSIDTPVFSVPWIRGTLFNNPLHPNTLTFSKVYITICKTLLTKTGSPFSPSYRLNGRQLNKETLSE
jgi:hypothetical protein